MSIDLLERRKLILNTMIVGNEEDIELDIKELFDANVSKLYMKLKSLKEENNKLTTQQELCLQDFKELRKDKLHLLDELNNLDSKDISNSEKAERYHCIFKDIHFYLTGFDKREEKVFTMYDYITATYNGRNLYKIHFELLSRVHYDIARCKESIIKSMKQFIEKSMSSIELQKKRLEIYNCIMNDTVQDIDIEIKTFFTERLYTLYLRLKSEREDLKKLKTDREEFLNDFINRYPICKDWIDELDYLELNGLIDFNPKAYDRFAELCSQITFLMADFSNNGVAFYGKSVRCPMYKLKSLRYIYIELLYNVPNQIKKHKEDITNLIEEII